MALMMSVSGIRGIVGQTMTPILAAEMGATFGSHIGGGLVVVGRDSRPSGDMLLHAMISGLLSTGCRVLDLGVVTTPGVAIMVRERQAAGGVVLTASHNPIVWNGIKFLTAQGCAPAPEEAQAILDRHRERRFNFVAFDHLQHAEPDGGTHDVHVGRVMGILDGAAIRDRRFKVVLDSVNGAGGLGGRMLLEKLGCQVIHMNAEPTGRFAHTPEPIAENLVELCRAVREQGADLGFAQDPDADRLAIVDDTGHYIGEEYTLALAAKFTFSRRRGPSAANLSTSRMIDDLAAAAHAGPVHRTAVGEANVARAVVEKGCVLGGEGNGGVIDPRVVLVRDSFVAMGLALNLLVDEGRSLSEVVAAMPRYVMVKQKFELEKPRIDHWLSRLPHAFTDARLDHADGLRLDWPQGWAHVRASNTEPIARVIAEARDRDTAEAIVRKVTDLL